MNTGRGLTILAVTFSRSAEPWWGPLCSRNIKSWRWDLWAESKGPVLHPGLFLQMTQLRTGPGARTAQPALSDTQACMISFRIYVTDPIISDFKTVQKTSIHFKLVKVFWMLYWITVAHISAYILYAVLIILTVWAHLWNLEPSKWMVPFVALMRAVDTDQFSQGADSTQTG